ncbi:MAG: IS110 family transposase, partial [Herbaspirillum sp.]|uniref:IS110 family transposase n=1 Tax=Herbaspirillum sp. TaxID=1890675 RepID=UPI002584B8DB
KTHRIPLSPKTCQRIDNRTRAAALAADVEMAAIYAIRAQALARQLHGLQTGIDQYRRRIRELFRLQPMAALFASLPGAGDKLAPRLLAMFGTCKDRYAGAKNVAELAGVAPVTNQSGNTCHVKFRHSCKKLYRTTMHQFAWTSMRFCPWARAYYDRCRDRGQSHPLALRNLAAKWLKIIYRMWQEDAPYDDARYLKALQHANSPLATKLNLGTAGG